MGRTGAADGSWLVGNGGNTKPYLKRSNAVRRVFRALYQKWVKHGLTKD
nr:MAG TPA: hypothetical protein [Myoviridae sp. ctDOq19]